MDKKVKIGPIGIEQYDEYRDLWLEALKNTPEAFHADYDEQADVQNEVWMERLKAVLNEVDGVAVFAQIDNKLVGMVGAFFDDNPKFKHIATIWGAYVKPEFRKQGVATDMAKELMKKLEERKELTKIRLYSITNAHLAVNVYKNFGFDIIGISKKELKIKDKYFDVYIMEKFIR